MTGTPDPACDLSLIVATHNRSASLKDLVDSAVAQETGGMLTFRKTRGGSPFFKTCRAIRAQIFSATE